MHARRESHEAQPLLKKQPRAVAVILHVELRERRGARVYSSAGEGTDGDGPTGRLMRQIIDAEPLTP